MLAWVWCLMLLMLAVSCGHMLRWGLSVPVSSVSPVLGILELSPQPVALKSDSALDGVWEVVHPMRAPPDGWCCSSKKQNRIESMAPRRDCGIESLKTCKMWKRLLSPVHCTLVPQEIWAQTTADPIDHPGSELLHWFVGHCVSQCYSTGKLVDMQQDDKARAATACRTVFFAPLVLHPTHTMLSH